MIEAKEPKGKMVIEFKAEKGHENKMFKDEREKVRERALMKDTEHENDSDESDDDYKL